MEEWKNADLSSAEMRVRSVGGHPINSRSNTEAICSLFPPFVDDYYSVRLSTVVQQLCGIV